jgi:hypothetical protein
MGEDEQIFLGAAILLAAAVGQRHEPVDESQIRIAVLDAHSLHEEVKKRRERIAAGQALGCLKNKVSPCLHSMLPEATHDFRTCSA